MSIAYTCLMAYSQMLLMHSKVLRKALLIICISMLLYHPALYLQINCVCFGIIITNDTSRLCKYLSKGDYSFATFKIFFLRSTFTVDMTNIHSCL